MSPTPSAVSAPADSSGPKIVPQDGAAGPAAATDEDFTNRLDRIFQAQRARRPHLAERDAWERIDALRRIVAWVEENREEIRRAGNDDFRKPATEVDVTEVYPVLSEARHAIRHLRSWMRPRRVKRTLAMASTRAWLRYEPKGSCLILSPWNYPFNLTVVPLVSALAAGNTAILKPSEHTPHMSALLARMVEELFEEDEVALFEGEADVAQALLARPFDHIFFTGSPRVGKLVMKAAAEHLATVTLELGGKSPVIVDRTAHLDDAAAKIAWGKWLNQGQTCIAPDYLLVERSIYDDFVDRLGRQIERFYGDDAEARHASPDLARIVGPGHFERLRTLLDDTVAQGAGVAFGGGSDAESRWIEPTLLVDVPEDSPAMREEIFGPILPILPYEGLTQALATIQAREKPLALYIFSNDQAAVERVLDQASSGGTCINDVALHYLHPNLPFGGINHSGHGSAHGIFGFRAFSHERGVLRHSRWSALKLMSPPYTRFVQRLVDLTVKYF
ncbi:MAG: aldehyde dehydrogenase family protein [Holophagales bacterium]|nr:aldehyde dehydrogenase family protein [Holophagales bacterium]